MTRYAADVGSPTLKDVGTPCLILDQDRMDSNVARLRGRLDRLGVQLRPHLKTAKSVDAARRVMTSPAGPATVSTLKEAEQFALAGVTDLTYAVGISPDKIDRVLALRASGVDLSVTLDTVEQAHAVAEASRQAGDIIPALIEIDCDGHRSGVLPGDRALLVAIAQALENGGNLRGVLTHAGASYSATDDDAIRAAAEGERAAAVQAATLLREAGFVCPVVSVGSTPTAHFAEALDGVTEVRAGVFVFFRSGHGRDRGLRYRRYRCFRAGHRDRTPAGQGLDTDRCRMDGDVARSWHRQTSGRSGLWPGL